MKTKFLTTALLAFAATAAFAQNGQLTTANEEYIKYEGLKGNAALAKPSLMNAKAAIDKAAANQKTSGLARTYALKGAIYAALAAQDADQAAASADFTTAQEALKKARELDTKNENAKMTDQASIELAQVQLNKGVSAYQGKNYDEAYKYFDAARQLRPEDTLTVLYSAVSAAASKKYSDAISNYNKLLTTNYKRKSDIYNDLPALYLANKDTAGALKAIDEGLAKFPGNNNLRRNQIEINLMNGHSADVIDKIQAAIKADPNNKALYYYEGLTYAQAAEKAGSDLKKHEKTKGAAAESAKLKQTRIDDFDKAAEMYQKALSIDPNYFDALLGLGYVTLAPAIDMYNAAVNLPVNQTKQYNQDMAKANAQFDKAKPYLTKAVELNPQSKEALSNLKSYYLGKKDTENANAVQKKIDALPAQ